MTAVVCSVAVSIFGQMKAPAVTMSALGREKMTHTISPAFHEGVLYGFYQAGELHTVEDVTDPTEVMRLSIIPWRGAESERRYLDVGARSQNFGSFIQTAERPACAQTAIVRENRLYLFFRGRRAVDQPGLWCYRVYDTVSKRLEDGAVICTLDGREFSGLTARDAYNRLSGDRQQRTALGDECNIRLFSDGWYYTVVSTGGDCVGLVVRSKNLKDWESVLTTPDLHAGDTWEYEIFELSPGKWMSAWRQEKLGGVWTAVYDVAAHRWSTPERVPDSIAVKPYLFAYRGRNYLATNLKGPVTTPGYGTVVRATLGIFSVDAEGRLKKARTIVNPTGCHYVSSFVDDKGDLYLCHSTDVRKLDATQSRSNIDCFKLELEKANWVNIGSNTGLFGFDWEVAGVSGLNLAGSPQSMRRGFAKVKEHRAEIADGAWIIIPMCPFSSVVPLRYDNRSSATNHPLLGFDGVPDAKAMDGFRDMLDRCWKGEFAIRDYAEEMSAANREAYRINVATFREFFAWCRSERLRPVVVNPPASRCFDGLFPASFMKAYIYDFIAETKPEDVPFLDYWAADDLRADRNFANALFMNRTGRRVFTKRVMADVQRVAR